MAFVLPIVAAVGTVVQAGAIGAALSTVGGFLSVAGGVLAGVGALTGKKDLVKLGGLFSLGSAAAGALGFGSASTGIGGAAEAASAATEGGTAIAGEGISATQMTEGVKGLGDSAALSDGANYSLAGGGSGGQGIMAQKLAQQAAQPSSLVADSGLLTQGTAKSLAATNAGMAPSAVSSPSDFTIANATQVAKPLPASAAGITQNDLQSVLSKGWQRAQDMLKNTGQFIKDNKELAQIGGQALSSMYGPQAEQMSYQRSIMDRINRNLNSPVRLGNVAPGG